MRCVVLAVTMLALPATAVAQSGGNGGAPPSGGRGEPPQRIRNVQLARGQACPKGEPGEVVVCSTLEEPYRIPNALRNTGPIPVPRQSWVNRAADVDQTSRVAGGLPDTCSVVGTGGQTGCASAYAQQWAAERKAGNVPGR